MRGYGLYSERWQPLIRPRCGHLLPLGEGCATDIVGLLASLCTIAHRRLPIADCRLAQSPQCAREMQKSTASSKAFFHADEGNSSRASRAIAP